MDWRRHGPLWLSVLLIALAVGGAVAVVVYDATRPRCIICLHHIGRAVAQYRRPAHARAAPQRSGRWRADDEMEP